MPTTQPATRYRGLLGRQANGDRVFVEIELRDQAGRWQTTEHDTVEGYRELAITGDVVHGSTMFAGGQVREDMAAVTEPAPGLTMDDVRTLVATAERWHLNGMQAGCAHQTVIWEDGPYGRRPSLTLTLPCHDDEHRAPYRYGSAWLVEALPVDVEQWVHDFGARLNGQHVGLDDRVRDA